MPFSTKKIFLGGISAKSMENFSNILGILSLIFLIQGEITPKRVHRYIPNHVSETTCYELSFSAVFILYLCANIDQNEAMRLKYSPNFHIVENNELCIHTNMVNTFLYGIKYE